MPPAEELYVENRTLREENAQLRAQLEWFKRKVFGGGQSEKLPPTGPAQAALALEGLTENAATPGVQTVTYERRTPSGEKRPLPAETFAKLPVHETVVVEPPEVQAAPQCFEKSGKSAPSKSILYCRNSLSGKSCARSIAAWPSGWKRRSSRRRPPDRCRAATRRRACSPL